MSVRRGVRLSSLLKKEIRILRPDAIDDGTATVAGAPIDLGGRRAGKTDVSSGERVRSAEQGQEVTSRFLMRRDALTATIAGADIIACEGRTYEVKGSRESSVHRGAIEVDAVARADLQ